MSETYKLGDICTIGSSKRVHLSDYVNNGVPFFRSKEIIELANGQNISEPLYISNEQYDEIKRRFPVPKKNDILITSVGTIGVCYLVKDGNFYFKDGNLTWLRDTNKNIVDIVFLIQWLKSNYFKRQILNNNIGAVQKAITINYLKKVKITLPDLPTQQKIASVLSALDDKIELNNRINAELEAMAKTLYDYWFVQFDFPVASTGSATTTGTATEISGENVASTPLSQQSDKKNTAAERSQETVAERSRGYKSSGGKMVYNKTLKREIPEGWEVKKLEEIEEKIVTGKTPSTKVSEYFNGNIPFITIDDIRKQFYVYNAERNLTILGAESQANKYVYSGDICVSCIGTIGIIGIVATTSQTNQQINTISQIKDYNRYFLLNSLKNYFEYNVGAKKGAVLDNMNKQEFSNIPILDANRNLKKLYFDKVNPIYEKIKLNLKQNQELSALRDWLLPMLMNGQVKVGEIVENKEAKIVELNKSQIVKPGDFKECFTDKDKKVCRKMLATFIINESLNDQSFGKTKFEKLLHLVEYHLVKGDFNQSYTVQAAGPYDGAFTKTFWSEVLKGEWFKIEELGSLKRIKAGKNHIKSLKDYGYFSESLKESVRGFVHKFSNSNYEQPEIISTLFAVWNNRIIRKEIITDELIKEDFLNWDLGKGKYANRLDKALDWMRKEGIIPNGWGKEIKRTKKNK